MNRIASIVLIAVIACWFEADISKSATLTGQVVRPGGTLDLRFPLSKYFQDYAARGGNTRPTTGHALMTFPNNFDPAQSWPILIIISTADYHWTNAMSAPPYQQAGLREGWIVLAADATIVPHDDSEAWRVALIGAALELIYKNWPQSTHWPVAFGGLSGGAKRAGFIAAMLQSSNKLRICGFFLAGINDDRISVAYKDYHLSSDFLNIPIWLSSGISDPLAPPFRHEHVRASLVNTGFKHVRLESFAGSHQVQPAQVQLALRWFRQLGNF
jgi:hypothetical protein